MILALGQSTLDAIAAAKTWLDESDKD